MTGTKVGDHHWRHWIAVNQSYGEVIYHQIKQYSRPESKNIAQFTMLLCGGPHSFFDLLCYYGDHIYVTYMWYHIYVVITYMLYHIYVVLIG